MKLNSWQWLAVVLLIVGCVWWVWDLSHPKKTASAVPPAGPTTEHIEAK